MPSVRWKPSGIRNSSWPALDPDFRKRGVSCKRRTVSAFRLNQREPTFQSSDFGCSGHYAAFHTTIPEAEVEIADESAESQNRGRRNGLSTAKQNRLAIFNLCQDLHCNNCCIKVFETTMLNSLDISSTRVSLEKPRDEATNSAPSDDDLQESLLHQSNGPTSGQVFCQSEFCCVQKKRKRHDRKIYFLSLINGLIWMGSLAVFVGMPKNQCPPQNTHGHAPDLGTYETGWRETELRTSHRKDQERTT